MDLSFPCDHGGNISHVIFILASLQDNMLLTLRLCLDSAFFNSVKEGLVTKGKISNYLVWMHCLQLMP